MEDDAVEEQPAVQRRSVLVLPVGVEGSGERSSAAEEEQRGGEESAAHTHPQVRRSPRRSERTSGGPLNNVHSVVEEKNWIFLCSPPHVLGGLRSQYELACSLVCYSSFSCEGGLKNQLNSSHILSRKTTFHQLSYLNLSSLAQNQLVLSPPAGLESNRCH